MHVDKYSYVQRRPFAAVDPISIMMHYALIKTMQKRCLRHTRFGSYHHSWYWSLDLYAMIYKAIPQFLILQVYRPCFFIASEELNVL